jgi:hypothetical protein
MASPALICDTEQWKALQVRQLVAALALRGLYALISIRQQAHFWFFCFHLEQAHAARRHDPEDAPAGPDGRRRPLQGDDDV